MIQKIEERLNKEIEKVIAKEELTHAEYYFLEKNYQMLKFEQNQHRANTEMFQGLTDFAKVLTSNKEGDKNV